MTTIPTESGVSKREKELTKQAESIEQRVATLREGLQAKQAAAAGVREQIRRLEADEMAAIEAEAIGQASAATIEAVQRRLTQARSDLSGLEHTIQVLTSRLGSVQSELVPVAQERDALKNARLQVAREAIIQDLAFSAYRAFLEFKSLLVKLYVADIAGRDIGLPPINPRFLASAANAVDYARRGLIAASQDDEIWVRDETDRVDLRQA